MNICFYMFRHSRQADADPGMKLMPAIIGAIMALAIVGCGKGHEAVHLAEGRVLWYGKPLAGAQVVLYPREQSDATIVKTIIPSYICPSSIDPTRLDGLPEKATASGSTWTATIAAPTDYSPTIGVDQRLVDNGLVDVGGTAYPGILPKNGLPRLADVTDGLFNTILYAESAGRPYVYRKGKRIGTIGNATVGTATDFVNAGGWARPASDFTIDGAMNDGATVGAAASTDVLYAINRTNGQDVGNTYAAPAGFPYYGTEGTSEVYAFHPGGANVVLGDGSVRLIDENIAIREFARLVTRAGGEEVVAQVYQP